MATVPVEGRPARRLRVDWNALLLSLPAFVFVMVLFIFPFIFGFVVSLQNAKGTALTLDNYRQFFGDSGQVSTILITLQVALPVTFFTVALSIPLAYFMRRGIRFERLINILLILPITLGTVMVAQAMERYFGPIGWFNQALISAHILQGPLPLLHNVLGVEIALFIQGFPFVFLLVVGYMSAIDPDQERASRMLGANTWQTFWRVIFPLTLPGIIVAFCLNFVSNFGVFPSAVLVGDPSGATRVLSVAAYDAFSNNNPPQATSIALIMGVLELLVVVIVLGLRNFVARGATISGGKGA
ncbi:MAG: ABC transporter permease subunit [Ktedonobacteraceae bacterium]|nr:ABC transporter permease subunit [Ktedonobacteraceae bacterium]